MCKLSFSDLRAMGVVARPCFREGLDEFFLVLWSSVVRASMRWVIVFGGIRGGAVVDSRLLLEVGCVGCVVWLGERVVVRWMC